ncbi:2Fe-2S iron-sulfur cluster-binding protein [Mesorhizobium wenxiniae]|uniref:2Fe-2S ferredoxin n=1 Tax=Mesorhizobium wenxiniae TaxID=2014805 RepID=A0A271K8J1_9HYPH|nr:2Fe-2S iron-sulfur cluster-binding protein [Mesorhizobium wenxiniae]PAP92056.1 2Fe-2S ferredoxin [Mesorhizobium wenxiniae]
MIRLVFITSNGSLYEVEAEVGSTAMKCAVRNSVPGIEAECGGACTCATCHVYVDDSWLAAVGETQAMEADMLDYASDVRANSRLSCQIKIQPSLNGLILRIPSKQG